MQTRKGLYVLAAITALAASAVYLPALRNGFVWDDFQYVVNNGHIRSLHTAFFRWAIADVSLNYWHPLEAVSHAVDYALWGLNPAGHHLSSVLLHGLNTALVVLAAYHLLEASGEAGPAGGTRALDKRSMLIAAGVTGGLFGIHPLHVESVAWIAERKDLLCAFFYLLSILAYLRYARARRGREGQCGPFAFAGDPRYLAAFGLFVLALAGKPMAVTLPAVLLLLDWRPLARTAGRGAAAKIILEKIPFVAAGVAVGVVTVLAQKAVGAVVPLSEVRPGERLLTAVWAVAAYIGKMAVPANLIPLYAVPRGLAPASFRFLAAAVFVVGVTALSVIAARKRPAITVAWGYYLITLLPVLGIIRVGAVVLADRFTYLPGIGPFFLAGLAAARMREKAEAAGTRGRLLKPALLAAAVVIGVLLAFSTIRQIAVWKSDLTLWSRVIEREPDGSPLPYHNRGLAYQDAGKTALARKDFDDEVRLDQSGYLGRFSRANFLLATGDLDGAIDDYSAAIRTNPRYVNAWYNRGLAERKGGRHDLAIADFTAAIRLRPSDADAYVMRGSVFSDLGRTEAAIADLTTAVSLDPGNAAAWTLRGMAYKARGQYELAVADYTRAIVLEPGAAEAYNNRGVAYKHLGRPDLALEDYGRAIDRDPSFALAYCNRGIVLGRLGRIDEAVADYTHSLELRPDMVRAYLDRGDLLRLRGETDRAQRDYEAACRLGSAEGCGKAAGPLRRR